jgi:hypothetical protein
MTRHCGAIELFSAHGTLTSKYLDSCQVGVSFATAAVATLGWSPRPNEEVIVATAESLVKLGLVTSHA